MSKIRNALPELMGRHRIKQAALAEAAGLRYATVNALYNGKTERVDFDTLASVLDGLRALTGRRYTVGDLLEYSEADAVPPGPAEVQAAHGLLIAPSKRGRARGLPLPVPIEGPPVEELLKEQRGPEL